MRRARPIAKTKTATRGLLSRALILLTLVVFAFQGFLTQTHIHIAVRGTPAVADTFDGVPVNKDKFPGKNDGQTCPLCQQFASIGQFITPAAAAVLLPSLSVSVLEVVAFVRDFVPPVTHTWRGRAPPQH